MTWNSTQVGNLRGGKTGKTILACVITTCPHQNFKLLVICLHFLLQWTSQIVLMASEEEKKTRRSLLDFPILSPSVSFSGNQTMQRCNYSACKLL
uniref:Uncharacterized protein LOC104228833 isoform X3 n=1 Tax=Nicotiana sylvestris TaxID=4096 RepID=A0A1U7WZN7_NICSY|nr:PREDICTED: uncharacterized protein LOC104228833 isoform X3 [Nicotiana sylvestris]